MGSTVSSKVSDIRMFKISESIMPQFQYANKSCFTADLEMVISSSSIQG